VIQVQYFFLASIHSGLDTCQTESHSILCLILNKKFRLEVSSWWLQRLKFQVSNDHIFPHIEKCLLIEWSWYKLKIKILVRNHLSYLGI
jgi:hypothetical protein